MNKLAIIEAEAAAELAQIKTAVMDYDREVRNAYNRQMGYAFLAGMALLRAEEIIPHGKFLGWCEKELSIKRTTSLRYRQFATEICKLPTVGNLKEVKLLTKDGVTLTDEQEEKVAAVVYKLADGKTLTEMYRDLGVIRQPEKPKHHPRKPVSAEDEVEARKLHARDLVDAWRAPLASWVLTVQNDPALTDYEQAEWELYLDELTNATTLAREKIAAARKGKAKR